jgi:hypothetical protein
MELVRDVRFDAAAIDIRAGVLALRRTTTHRERIAGHHGVVQRERHRGGGGEMMVGRRRRSGEIDHEVVIFPWITNASLAVSIEEHVVLLDTYVHRPEIVPGRTPFVVEDLLNRACA